MFCLMRKTMAAITNKIERTTNTLCGTLWRKTRLFSVTSTICFITVSEKPLYELVFVIFSLPKKVPINVKDDKIADSVNKIYK